MASRTGRCGTPEPVAKVLKAEGPSVFRIGFDPVEFAKLPHFQREQLWYHFERVLMGETSAISEWELKGLKVDLRPWTKP